jgi:hypothetical protein
VLVLIQGSAMNFCDTRLANTDCLPLISNARDITTYTVAMDSTTNMVYFSLSLSRKDRTTKIGNSANNQSPKVEIPP